jgi:hypothetical protein
MRSTKCLLDKKVLACPAVQACAALGSLYVCYKGIQYLKSKFFSSTSSSLSTSASTLSSKSLEVAAVNNAADQQTNEDVISDQTTELQADQDQQSQ